MPKKHQAEARTLLCAMPYAETQAACEALRAEFTTRYRKLAPKAVERLADDWERLVTFYQFPREHWPHLRTTNVVESPFATVRLRTTAAKRFKKVENATALIWKMLQVAESTFRRLKGAELLPAVYAGAQYVDGVQRTMSTPQQDGRLTGGHRPFSLVLRARKGVKRHAVRKLWRSMNPGAGPRAVAAAMAAWPIARSSGAVRAWMTSICEDLKAELIKPKRVAADEDGEVLVWTGKAQEQRRRAAERSRGA